MVRIPHDHGCALPAAKLLDLVDADTLLDKARSTGLPQIVETGNYFMPVLSKAREKARNRVWVPSRSFGLFKKT
jgi:hypothetical protein